MAFAAYWGNVGAMKVLLRDGHIVDSRAFNASALMGELGAINFLLAQKKFLVPRTAVEFAAAKGHVAVLERISLRADYDFEYEWLTLINTPKALAYAAEAGRMNILKFILETNWDVRKKRKLDGLPLRIRPNSDVLKRMEIPVSALILAGRKGHVEIVKLLHEHGVVFCSYAMKQIADGMPKLRLPPTVRNSKELLFDDNQLARENARRMLRGHTVLPTKSELDVHERYITILRFMRDHGTPVPHGICKDLFDRCNGVALSGEICGRCETLRTDQALYMIELETFMQTVLPDDTLPLEVELLMCEFVIEKIIRAKKPALATHGKINAFDNPFGFVVPENLTPAEARREMTWHDRVYKPANPLKRKRSESE